MERLNLQQLTEWKNNSKRKPLILNGARQVGKTWLLHEFAKKEYKKEAYFVCRKNAVLKNIFIQDFNMERILRSLRALSGTDITPDDTLIIFDEVQEIPEIIESLKYFSEELPQYHVAVAGSLLGISLHNNISFPVGKVDTINVYPMSFEEFLIAKGEKETYNLLNNKDFEATNLIHDKLIDLLRQYYFVGGMPEAVKEYIDTESLIKVREIQSNIIKGYEMDFSKHVPSDQIARVRMVWKSIPSQLFKDNKKFIYGALKKGARANDFELAIQWLIDAGLLYKVPLCNKIALPLEIYEDLSAFKLYLSDIGLLGAMVQIDAQQILIDNNIFSEYKGGMTEQYVLQELICNQKSHIYYHKTGNSRLELDFIIKHKAQVFPIEVKAGTNIRANSLISVLHNNLDMHAARFSMLPYKEQEQITNVPLYAVGVYTKDSNV